MPEEAAYEELPFNTLDKEAHTDVVELTEGAYDDLPANKNDTTFGFVPSRSMPPNAPPATPVRSGKRKKVRDLEIEKERKGKERIRQQQPKTKERKKERNADGWVGALHISFYY